MTAYLLTPAAERDLEDIWRYTARTWSIVQAENYTGDLIDAFENLAAGTRGGVDVEGFPRYRKYLVGRHAIFFRDDGAGLVVVRVLHQSMDPERHI